MNEELINEDAKIPKYVLKRDGEFHEKGTEAVEHLWDKCPQEEEKEEEKMRHPLSFHAEGKKICMLHTDTLYPLCAYVTLVIMCSVLYVIPQMHVFSAFSLLQLFIYSLSVVCDCVTS